MSKAGNNSNFNQGIKRAAPELETTLKGVELARAVLAKAQVQALEAEQEHRLNLEAELKAERAIIAALREELLGRAAALEVQAQEAAERGLLAEAEEALKGEQL
jgi:hypothetical protein